MFVQQKFLTLFIILFVVLLLITIIYVGTKMNNSKIIKKFSKKTKSFVINLEKNADRLARFTDSYDESDINIIPLERFNAVNGKTLELQKYVTDKAYDQINSAETNGYRLRHYELTRGAVGCFMSHTTLYKKLLDDREHDFYLIFEDDAFVPQSVIKPLQLYLDNAPYDWDIIVFGVIREVIDQKGKLFDKVKTWWGLFGYAINKKGAKKFVNELNQKKRIDKQIDSMMSMMIQEKKLNVYSSSVHLIKHDSDGTDIQLPIKLQSDINPYNYENVELYTDFTLNNY
jgi:GR25 family glycosyltransferase involved in LPS biosynthesis